MGLIIWKTPEKGRERLILMNWKENEIPAKIGGLEQIFQKGPSGRKRNGEIWKIQGEFLVSLSFHDVPFGIDLLSLFAITQN